MIRSTIETINDRISQQLRSTNVDVAGMSIPFHDQQERAVSLKLADTQQRFGMNSKLVWQSTHLLDGMPVTSSRTWGSFNDNTYDARFVLIGLSKSQSGLNVAMQALDGIGYVVIDGLENDTLTVLQRYFRVRVGQDKNYDPALFAFAIRYRLTGVRDEDFTDIPDEVDVAALPLYFMELEPDADTDVMDVPNLLLNYNISKL